MNRLWQYATLLLRANALPSVLLPVAERMPGLILREAAFAISATSVCAFLVLHTIRRAEYAELSVLFFIQGAALAMWLVPLSAILDAHGLRQLRPFAFATTALAAFVSPLIFGAMADRHASPVKVLRGLALATAAAMTLASSSIAMRWNAWIVLACIQLHALCSAPTFSIASTIVFARLQDAQKEFGPIRAMATVGWMTGCWTVSLLGADASALAGYSGAIVWLCVAVFTFWLPTLETPKSAEHLTWHERLGLDALTLLKNRDHRVVFAITTTFNIALAAFFPYTPPHMLELGLRHVTAWMSLGQVLEVIAMFSLGALLLRWRLKWVLALGLGLGALRFTFCATNTPLLLLGGVLLHGASYTLVFITAQIYLEQRVDRAWRARAQALMSLMNNGVGNLIGFLGWGLWFNGCTSDQLTNWTTFWLGVALVVIGVFTYFMIRYRGQPQSNPSVHRTD